SGSKSRSFHQERHHRRSLSIARLGRRGYARQSTGQWTRLRHTRRGSRRHRSCALRPKCDGDRADRRGQVVLRRRRYPRIPNAEGYFGFARNSIAAVAKHFPAPLKCVDAVAAAVAKPFDDGLRYERGLFLELVQTPESRALRHAFFAERAAAKIPDVPNDTPLRTIEKIAVVGAGTMGAGITMNFLSAGIPVALLEMKQEALDRGLATIRRNYEASARKGR